MTSSRRPWSFLCSHVPVCESRTRSRRATSKAVVGPAAAPGPVADGEDTTFDAGEEVVATVLLVSPLDSPLLLYPRVPAADEESVSGRHNLLDTGNGGEDATPDVGQEVVTPGLLTPPPIALRRAFDI